MYLDLALILPRARLIFTAKQCCECFNAKIQEKHSRYLFVVEVIRCLATLHTLREGILVHLGRLTCFRVT